MECFFGLIGLLGLVMIATGVLYYKRPDIQWRVQQWSQELWGDIRVQQGENWGCWSRVGVVMLIGFGLYMLWTAVSLYPKVQSSEATLSAAYTELAATRTGTAIDPAEQPAIARLEAIFAPLMPTLEGRAQAAPGGILLLTDAERRRYGLQSNPVYFGICGTNKRFYVIVENWGPAQATYQYAYNVSGSFPRTDCGSWQVNGFPYRWVRMPENLLDYKAELQETRSTATPMR